METSDDFDDLDGLIEPRMVMRSLFSPVSETNNWSIRSALGAGELGSTVIE